ncbi:hypothetical protein LY71_12435 [Geodermatophilus tzadiensis]|uniref:Uncharacterized protein n=1 Tax=Geodermatophilus tzadiensis TaxID=1137988 RepID=A0A2T0SUU2_9ACTN|nr:hypothetical protein LY71_12435 [Geodermatophilus tzadiensis]
MTLPNPGRPAPQSEGPLDARALDALQSAVNHLTGTGYLDSASAAVLALAAGRPRRRSRRLVVVR